MKPTSYSFSTAGATQLANMTLDVLIRWLVTIFTASMDLHSSTDPGSSRISRVLGRKTGELITFFKDWTAALVIISHIIFTLVLPWHTRCGWHGTMRCLDNTLPYQVPFVYPCRLWLLCQESYNSMRENKLQQSPSIECTHRWPRSILTHISHSKYDMWICVGFSHWVTQRAEWQDFE